MDDNKKQAVQQIGEANMLALQNGQKADSATQQFAALAEQLQAVASQLSQSGLGDAAALVSSSIQRLNQLPVEIGEVIANSDRSEFIVEELQKVTESIQQLRLDPTIRVDAPKVNIPAPDFKPLLNSLDDLKKAQKQETPTDLSPVVDALKEVKTTINSLSFPAANFILPFKDSTGKATQAQLDSNGNLPTSSGPTTTGGLSIHRSIDLDEGALEVVKASPGAVYSMWVANTATSTRFIKFYDATSGTAGTGTPLLTIPVPGNTSDDIAGVFNTGGLGITFATGICVGATTGVADADTGAPAANDVIVNIGFK